MVLKLVLKSILKYKRRTFTVFFSILFSVVVFVFAQGFIDGFNNMLMDVIYNDLGHVTIQHEEYEKKAGLFSIDYMVSDFSEIVENIELDGIKEISGGLRFAGILASDTESVEMIGRGVEIQKRGAASNFRKTMEKGDFLESRGEIVMSTEIARLLEVDVGSRLMILSTNSFGGFDVVELELTGLFDTGIPEEDENIFLISLKDASSLLKLNDTVSSIEIKLDDYSRSREVAETLNAGMLQNRPLRAYPWEETQPGYKNVISVSGVFLSIMFIVIVAVVGTGIINSILMSVYERFRDFGTIRAIGMKKRGLFFLIVAESTVIGSVATLIGIVLGGIITALLLKNGIDLGARVEQMQGLPKVLYPVFNIKTVSVSFVFGILISAFGSLLPALSASKLRVVEIMRHK